MKKLMICLLAISISSCAQQKEATTMTKKISEVYKEVKHRDAAIHYHADFYTVTMDWIT
ncbi:hypothetical protein [Aquimarina longa]|uniref:hypothetical protein n=1 Tax=Aquimarina longa TaxID=1080221 RepID=UPI000B10D5BB|nr:hypothetical protein [Aquimarina longa]